MRLKEVLNGLGIDERKDKKDVVKTIFLIQLDLAIQSVFDFISKTGFLLYLLYKIIFNIKITHVMKHALFNN